MQSTLCFIALCLLATHHISAQVNEQTLTGTWLVNKVNVIELQPANPPTDPKQPNILRQTFDKTIFVLKADHSCNIKLGMTGARVPKGYWTYDSVNTKIDIVNWEQRNNNSDRKMFVLFVKDKDGQSFWIIEEKEFLFEMEMRKSK